MAAIALEKLTKVYSTGVRALDGLDLRVTDGEFVVLVGRPAAGRRPPSAWWPAWKPSPTAP